MKTKRGFTLTELAVAIAFTSILILTIAVVTMDMVRNYHKGLTMKTINSVGLDLIDEFSSAISESPVFDIESLCKSLGPIGTKDNATGLYSGGDNGADTCMNNGAQEYIYQQFSQQITVKGNPNPIELPSSGVFCTGKYSYVWNTGYVIQNREGGNISASHTMSSGLYSRGTSLDNGFRLRKYLDSNRSFCYNNFPYTSGNSGPKHYPDQTPAHKRQNILASSMGAGVQLSEELISASDIAIYSITINSPRVNDQSGRSLYAGSFVLGSITGDIDLNTSTGGEFSSCNLENTSKFDVEYCATNKFNFAIRAMGGNSGN